MFGCTLIGYPSYLKGHQNDGYVEPCYLKKKTSSAEDETVPEQPATDVQPPLKNLDVYNQLVDGFAYCSSDRLRWIRRAHMHRPTTVKDEFRVPATTNMIYGWDDGNDEDVKSWTRIRDPVPVKLSDATRWFASLSPSDRLALQL